MVPPSRLFLLVAAIVSVAWDLPDPSAGAAKNVGEMQSALDLRPTVRQSLGLRSAQAVGDHGVKLEVGLSVTGSAGNAESYRIISFDDPAYDYKKFVRPVSVKVHKEFEAKGAEGSMQGEFSKTVVDLVLPEPMKPGAKYHVVAQGDGAGMVTAARAAAVVAETGQPSRDPAVDLAVLGLRRIEPVGNGILLVEFGPGFSPKAGAASDAYKVTVNGNPREIAAIGRLTRVDAYLPVGWPFKAIPVHEMFLQLATPFQDGDKIQLEVGEKVTGGSRVASLDFREATSFSPSIKTNQVGYLTESPVKIAYLGRWLGSFPMQGSKPGSTGGGATDAAFWRAVQEAQKKPAADPAEEEKPASAQPVEGGGAALYFPEPPPFRMHAAENGKVVFEAKSRLIHRSGEMSEGVRHVDFSGENVYELNFTEFKKPGRYFLSVPGVGRSQDFLIGDDVYEQAFQVQSYGVFAQRSGQELDAPYSPWHRVASLKKGIVPTTLSRYDGNAFQQLPITIERGEAKPFVLPPALEALIKDPALLAYWPMNGSTKDISGHSHDLVPLGGKPEFSEASEVIPGGNLAYGPTKDGAENGFQTDPLDLAAGTGVTFSLWVKMANGMKFDGVLIGSSAKDTNIPQMQISSIWGFYRGVSGCRGESVTIGRLEDGWHHVALVLDRKDGGDGMATSYVDGFQQGKSPAGTGVLASLPFLVGKLAGDEAGGKLLDEIRVYGRPLSAEEISVLARKWGESSNTITTFGGHHDAGDYNPRSHIEVAQILMDAYEMEPQKFHDGDLNLPESGNGIPDILDEAAWAMRLWPPLQRADGAVRAGTESNGDPTFVQTVELDKLGDFAFAPDAEASFQFAATFAQAARIWRGLGKTAQADEWLAMAEKAYKWADANRPKAEGAGELSARYLSPKAYAAAELLHTTGKANYNDDFLKVAVWKTLPASELDVYNLYDQQNAAWAYVNCPSKSCDPAVQESIRRAIIKRADDYIALCSTLAYKSYRHPFAPISWGTAAYPHTLAPVIWAYKLTKEPKYLEWIIRTCDNTLGTNPLGRSYIVGLGGRTVRAPLHNSRFSHFGEVVPGMQVQGPNQRGEGYQIVETAFPPIRADFASLYTYVDAHFAIAMDEGTIPSQARCMALFGLLRPDPKPDGTKK